MLIVLHRLLGVDRKITKTDPDPTATFQAIPVPDPTLKIGLVKKEPYRTPKSSRKA
jgi:hypothetical protein